MNGEHEVRLQSIERSLRDLHEKVDALVEQGAVNRTEIVWVKWGLRLVAAALAGLGGAATSGVL